MKQIAFIALVSILSLPLMAKTLSFGSGSQGGSYYGMVEDVKTYCSDALSSEYLFENVINGKGSVGTLVGMSNKELIGGMVQEDVLQFYAKNDPRRYNQNRLKIISGMHVETGHLLIPKDYKPEGSSSIFGSFMAKFSSKPPEPLSIDTLKNQKIAAWGGSIVSAKALSYFLDLNATVVSIKPEQASKSKYPLLIVAGQPSSTVQKLLSSGRFILAPIDYMQLGSRQPFYVKMDANYEVNGEIRSIQTFGVRAYLIGKAFRKESRNAPMITLAGCINEQLVDMADDPDTNPNWTSVYEINERGAQTNWSYFPLQ